MTAYGADVEALERLAADLDKSASELHSMLLEGAGSVALATLGTAVATIWRGPRSRDFANLWQSRHLVRLNALHDMLEQAARQVRSEAEQQRRASDGGSGTLRVVPGVVGALGSLRVVPGGNGRMVPGNVLQPSDRVPLQGSQQPRTEGSNNAQGASSQSQGRGALPPSGGVAAYEKAAGIRSSSAGYAQGKPANGRIDKWGYAAYNCTSWAAFRRAELGMSPPPRGNGGAMGTDPNLPPTLGAIASYGSGQGSDYGHVMIVEEVYSPDRIRVSEMNRHNDGGYHEDRIWERQPDGTWLSTQPYRKQVVLKFTP